MEDRPFLRAWKTMELCGEVDAGDEQPQCVSRARENRRDRNLRHARPEAAAATITNATGCCQSIQAQDNPEASARNREFSRREGLLTRLEPGGQIFRIEKAHGLRAHPQRIDAVPRAVIDNMLRHIKAREDRK